MAEAWWRVAGRDLLGLVLPVCCAGCGADDVSWCPECAATLDRAAWRAEERAGRLDRMDGRPSVPVWAVADFTGPMRRAVSAWKDHGRGDLTPVLAAAVRRSARALVDAPEGPGAQDGPPAAPALLGACGPAGGAPLVVVPAPSTPAARRARGWDPAGTLAGAVADELVRYGVPARPAGLLRRLPGVDQAGLSARARARNLSGQIRVRRRPRPGPGRVVLVDDVLTTGATFAACVRALELAGSAVVAGVVVASTPSPGVVVERGGSAR